MRFRPLISLLIVLCLRSTASASSIGVFFSPDATDYEAIIPANTPATWYILAVLGGDAAAGGTTGAEFRQVGTPAGWFMSPAADPAATSIGNPIAGGANIAFPACRSGGVVLLYTVSGLATTLVHDHPLSIDRHSTPSNSNFSCPLLVLCDAPVFTTICVSGGYAMINYDNLGVEPASWSSVKGLFD
jgi:hypothetical protein